MLAPALGANDTVASSLKAGIKWGEQLVAHREMRRLALSELPLARLYCMDLGSGDPVDIARVDISAAFEVALTALLSHLSRHFLVVLSTSYEFEL